MRLIHYPMCTQSSHDNGAIGSSVDTAGDSFEPSPDDAAQKSKNQLKNEAKRKEKMEKYLAKQEKQAQSKVCSSFSKLSIKKEKTSSTGHSVPVDDTLPGEKKGTGGPMPASYHPKYVEAGWYAWWEKKGFFCPEAVLKNDPNAPVYVIPIPPPNVTGSLHLGHAMATSIQDVLVRWRRMKGYAALYVPGCDHAGIACQVVVERNLKKGRNLTRHDLGREAFVEEVWHWRETYGDRIYTQLKRLGGSMDWGRARFTLDPSMSEAVVEAFVSLFDQGVIYRDNRLVNWSAALQTTVSDLEVDHQEIPAPTRLSAHGHDPKKTYEFGILYSFAVKILDQQGHPTSDKIVVSTTRPETIPGDVAVAVHPDDPRYKATIYNDSRKHAFLREFHGRMLLHPVHKTAIPLVCDTYADMSFGTGAVKLTPAHDLNDYEVAMRHSLPLVDIFDDFNRLNEKAGPFSGLMRFDAREAIVSYLEKEGLFVGKAAHPTTLPICNRSGDIIEPRIRPQWWMKCEDMAKEAVAAVREKKLQIIPREAEKIWFNWLENCKDWCLSRQLWWGHRVPAYSVLVKEKPSCQFVHKMWVAARSEQDAIEKAIRHFPEDGNSIRVEQDADVLDTWFSSGLWPFATLGWPNETAPDYKKFYPTSVLETGRDIIFFWVARMVMLGIHLTGQIPFHTVFLHSIVRDAHGRKMSKSLGNVIDPIDVIQGITLEELHGRLEQGNLDPSEIKKAKEGQRKDFPSGIEECGTDALRFALCSYTSQGSDVNLDIMRVDGYRRFCNKIWNLAKFAAMKFGPDYAPSSGVDLEKSPHLYDKWILGRLAVAAEQVNGYLEEFNFMKATSSIYNFVLYELCDIYVEAVKPTMQNGQSKDVLYTCIDGALKLLHPFMPFITEELWQRLPKGDLSVPESISLCRLPDVSSFKLGNEATNEQVSFIQSVVHCARSLVNDHSLKGQVNVEVNISDPSMKSLLLDHSMAVHSLIKNVDNLTIRDNDKGPGESQADGIFSCLVQGSSGVVALLRVALSTKGSAGPSKLEIA